MSADGKKIIIVRKKKGGHGGHHGGAWKVAYADFVTAMMAFFLVMWILGMDQGVKDVVEGYFSNPVGFKRAFSGGATIISVGSSPMSTNAQRNELLTREHQVQKFQEAAKGISDQLEGSGLGESLDMTVNEEGLRIELMETGEGGIFFDQSSAELKPTMQSALEVITAELRELPNAVVVEGHTDGVPFGSQGYSNWELSVDRANAARRVLVGAGLELGRIWEVRGHAARKPKFPEDLRDPRNRRITILLPFEEVIITEQFSPVAGHLPVPGQLPPVSGETSVSGDTPASGGHGSSSESLREDPEIDGVAP